MDDLPTAKTTRKTRYVDLQAKRSCMRMCNVDLEALVDAGDVPLVQLRFRCSYCGHRRLRRPGGAEGARDGAYRMTRIVTYTHRYKRPPCKKKPAVNYYHPA